MRVVERVFSLSGLVRADGGRRSTYNQSGRDGVLLAANMRLGAQCFERLEEEGGKLGPREAQGG